MGMLHKHGIWFPGIGWAWFDCDCDRDYDHQDLED